jgi:hypothetical protein
VVRDGVHTSIPGVISIEVNTGSETIPPEIFSTYPPDQAKGVLVYNEPLFSGVYAPTILAYTSEPLDSTSISPATVSLVDHDGSQLEYEVAYNSYLNAIQIVLHEPLVRMETYSVTITTNVLDTSGNPLETAYEWRFNTEKINIYLPLLLK